MTPPLPASSHAPIPRGTVLAASSSTALAAFQGRSSRLNRGEAIQPPELNSLEVVRATFSGIVLVAAVAGDDDARRIHRRQSGTVDPTRREMDPTAAILTTGVQGVGMMAENTARRAGLAGWACLAGRRTR